MIKLTMTNGKELTIRQIMAIDKDGYIGYDSQLIFYNPNDLEFFKTKTTNHIVVMGWKTFRSMGNKVLPDRQSVIVTKHVKEHQATIDALKLPPNTKRPRLISDPFQGLLEIAEELDETSIWIIGGASMYALYEPYTATWVSTIYDIHLIKDGVAQHILQEDYDPELLVKIDTSFRQKYSSLLEMGTFNGIKYRTKSYIRNFGNAKTGCGISSNEYQAYIMEHAILNDSSGTQSRYF